MGAVRELTRAFGSDQHELEQFGIFSKQSSTVILAMRTEASSSVDLKVLLQDPLAGPGGAGRRQRSGDYGRGSIRTVRHRRRVGRVSSPRRDHGSHRAARGESSFTTR